MNSWDNNTYRRIDNVKLKKNTIEVLFENGDNVEVELKSLLPTSFDDNVLEVSNDLYDIQIKSDSETIFVPWSKVRVITDVAFSKHMVQLADDQARQVGKKIKALRERKGIKGNELAERSGLTAQTISRIERGHTDVSFATLRKMLAAMGLSLKDLADYDTEKVSEKSWSVLLTKLAKVGIDSKFLLRKIIPERIDIEKYKNNLPPLLLDEITTYIKSVYNWGLEDLWGNKELQIDDTATNEAFYKRPANSNIHQIKAYSHYAYYIAKLVLKQTTNLDQTEYPGDTDELRAKFDPTKPLGFEECLNVIWDLGICVIPLRDKGVFHGASWNIDGRHIIVLKQTSNSQAKWLFDLLHELYHVFVHLDSSNTSVIELEDINPSIDQGSVEEAEANAFAHKVLLGDDAEKLLSASLTKAKHKVENLKNAVEHVASEATVGKDVLANYIAYRLSFQGQNWWGTANGMQITEPDPYQIAVECLKKRMTINSTNPIESNLLSMALKN